MSASHTRAAAKLAATMALIAITAPVASARPIDDGYTAPKPVTTPALRTVVVHQSGFDWADAAIGGAAAAGLLGLTGAAMLVARRPREDANAPLGVR
jgi:hypothetical protein